MYVKESNLEEVKTIETKYGSETIYQLKDKSISEVYLIPIETLIGMCEDEFILNCAQFETLEQAEEEARMFIDMRREA